MSINECGFFKNTVVVCGGFPRTGRSTAAAGRDPAGEDRLLYITMARNQGFGD